MPGRAIAPSQLTPLAEAHRRGVGHDDMVEELDAEKRTGVLEPTGEEDVVGRWRGIAAGMIMTANDRAGSDGHGRAVDRARVHRAGINAAAPSLVIAEHASFYVEQEDHEALLGVVALWEALHKATYGVRGVMWRQRRK